MEGQRRTSGHWSSNSRLISLSWCRRIGFRSNIKDLRPSQAEETSPIWPFRLLPRDSCEERIVAGAEILGVAKHELKAAEKANLDLHSETPQPFWRSEAPGRIVSLAAIEKRPHLPPVSVLPPNATAPHPHRVARQMRQPVEPAGVGQRLQHDDVPVRRGADFIGDVGAGETGSPS